MSRTTNVLLRFRTSTSVGRRGCLLYMETGAAIASPLDGSARLTPNPGDAPDGRRTLTCLATLICTGRCTWCIFRGCGWGSVCARASACGRCCPADPAAPCLPPGLGEGSREPPKEPNELVRGGNWLTCSCETCGVNRSVETLRELAALRPGAFGGIGGGAVDMTGISVRVLIMVHCGSLSVGFSGFAS